MTFQEAGVIRDAAGRFGEKPQSGAEVSLSTQEDAHSDDAVDRLMGVPETPLRNDILRGLRLAREAYEDTRNEERYAAELERLNTLAEQYLAKPPRLTEENRFWRETAERCGLDEEECEALDDYLADPDNAHELNDVATTTYGVVADALRPRMQAARDESSEHLNKLSAGLGEQASYDADGVVEVRGRQGATRYLLRSDGAREVFAVNGVQHRDPHDIPGKHRRIRALATAMTDRREDIARGLELHQRHLHTLERWERFHNAR